MSSRFEHWLKNHLERLVGVQRCTFGGPAALNLRPLDARLTIHMWTGIKIHVYILAEAVKTRQVRDAVRDDTDVGIGALFVVHPGLLPAPGAVEATPEWLLAVHALSAERIYTFCDDDGDPCLMQIHLEPTTAATRFRAVYGPPVFIDRLHYQRTTVKQRYIKGFWMVAHFGADPFWRDSNGGAAHYYRPPHPPRARPSAAANGRREPPPAAPPPPRTALERSYALLGVGPAATRAEVKAAFRRMALTLHPDVSPLEKAEAETRFKALNEAYAIIKAYNKWG